MQKEQKESTQEQMPDQEFHVALDGDSVHSNITLLMEEYHLGEEIGGKYFSYLYSTMNFTFIMYAAIIAVFQSLFKNFQCSSTYLLIFSYLLPVMTYILGLFYAYNAVAISRQGYFMICIEKDLKRLCTKAALEYPIHGWNILAKEPPWGGFILPYGTMLCFYSLSPAFFVVFNIRELKWKIMFSTTFRGVFRVIVVPMLFYLVYIIFMVILIVAMARLRRMCSNEINPNKKRSGSKRQH